MVIDTATTGVSLVTFIGARHRRSSWDAMSLDAQGAYTGDMKPTGVMSFAASWASAT